MRFPLATRLSSLESTRCASLLYILIPSPGSESTSTVLFWSQERKIGFTASRLCCSAVRLSPPPPQQQPQSQSARLTGDAADCGIGTGKEWREGDGTGAGSDGSTLLPSCENVSQMREK